MKISEHSLRGLSDIITGNTGISPYRTGDELVNFFKFFGFNDVYGRNFPSRWHYAFDKLCGVNGTDTLSKIIEFALDPRYFIINKCEIEASVNYLNELLNYESYEIIKKDKFYKVKSIDNISQNQSFKNLIFAANGPKPEIIIDDAIDNHIKIVKNADKCLIYDRELSPEKGLSYQDLVDWWSNINHLENFTK